MSAAPCMPIESSAPSEGVDDLRAGCAVPIAHPRKWLFRSSRALSLSGVGEKGGARLLGCAAVQPFYSTINGLKNRLRLEQEICGLTVRNCRSGAKRAAFWAAILSVGRLSGPQSLLKR
jgi:hypothetical protein